MENEILELNAVTPAIVKALETKKTAVIEMEIFNGIDLYQNIDCIFITVPDEKLTTVAMFRNTPDKQYMSDSRADKIQTMLNELTGGTVDLKIESFDTFEVMITKIHYYLSNVDVYNWNGNKFDGTYLNEKFKANGMEPILPEIKAVNFGKDPKPTLFKWNSISKYDTDVKALTLGLFENLACATELKRKLRIWKMKR